jgi:hypothetical protein
MLCFSRHPWDPSIYISYFSFFLEFPLQFLRINRLDRMINKTYPLIPPGREMERG